MNNSEKVTSDQVTRRDAIKKFFLGLGAGILGLFTHPGEKHMRVGGVARCVHVPNICRPMAQTFVPTAGTNTLHTGRAAAPQTV